MLLLEDEEDEDYSSDDELLSSFSMSIFQKGTTFLFEISSSP